MQKTIILQSKDDLTYLIGALVHGEYTVSSYEDTYFMTDESQTKNLKFNIYFKVPTEKRFEEVFSKFE